MPWLYAKDMEESKQSMRINRDVHSHLNWRTSNNAKIASMCRQRTANDESALASAQSTNQCPRCQEQQAVKLMIRLHAISNQDANDVPVCSLNKNTKCLSKHLSCHPLGEGNASKVAIQNWASKCEHTCQSVIHTNTQTSPGELSTGISQPLIWLIEHPANQYGISKKRTSAHKYIQCFKRAKVGTICQLESLSSNKWHPTEPTMHQQDAYSKHPTMHTQNINYCSTRPQGIKHEA